MNLKALAARFAELHPQYKYDATNHVWVMADGDALVYPTDTRIIGSEVQALTERMIADNNAGNAKRSKRPRVYLHQELFIPLRHACTIKPPKRSVAWADADRLARLRPEWVSRRTSYAGVVAKDGPGISVYHRTQDIEVSVHRAVWFGHCWRASMWGCAVATVDVRTAESVCRFDALRRLLNSHPWLLKGLTGPEVA